MKYAYMKKYLCKYEGMHISQMRIYLTKISLMNYDILGQYFQL